MFAAVCFVRYVERLQNLGELRIQRNIARLRGQNFRNLFAERFIQIPTVERIARLHGIRQCNCRAFRIVFRVSMHAAIHYVSDTVYLRDFCKLRIQRNIPRLRSRNFRYFIRKGDIRIPTAESIIRLARIRQRKRRTLGISFRIRMRTVFRHISDVKLTINLVKLRIKRNITRLRSRNFRYSIRKGDIRIPTVKGITVFRCICKLYRRTLFIHTRVCAVHTTVQLIGNLRKITIYKVEENTRRRCTNAVCIIAHQEQSIIARRGDTISNVQGVVCNKFNVSRSQKIGCHLIRIVAVTAIIHIKQGCLKCGCTIHTTAKCRCMENRHVQCLIVFKYASRNSKRRCAIAFESRSRKSGPRRRGCSRNGQYARRIFVLPALFCNRAKFTECACIASDNLTRKLFVGFPIVVRVFYCIRIGDKPCIIAAVRIFINALRIRLISGIIFRVIYHVAVRTITKRFPIRTGMRSVITYKVAFSRHSKFLRFGKFFIKEQCGHHCLYRCFRNQRRILVIIVRYDLIIACTFDGKRHVCAVGRYRRFRKRRTIMCIYRIYTCRIQYRRGLNTVVKPYRDRVRCTYLIIPFHYVYGNVRLFRFTQAKSKTYILVRAIKTVVQAYGILRCRSRNIRICITVSTYRPSTSTSQHPIGNRRGSIRSLILFLVIDVIVAVIVKGDFCLAVITLLLVHIRICKPCTRRIATQKQVAVRTVTCRFPSRLCGGIRCNVRCRSRVS